MLKTIKVTEYIEDNKQRFLSELFELIKIPTISTDSAYKKDIQTGAEWIKNNLENSGIDLVEIHQTEGHPIVYGEKIINPDLPTVLVYGHYDVQPPDPVELWNSPPFEPEIRKTDIHPNGAIFARGACDDKGQMFMHIKAFEAMMGTESLHCNVKFMIEGEEEVGSVNLEKFVKANKEKLAADICLVSDTGMFAKNVPSITVGLRGLSYVEVHVTGPNRDLHSGIYGGAVVNPINALCEMIASLKNEKNEITIPGFYDKVLGVSPEEREAIKKAPFNEDSYKKSIGISDVDGEHGYSSLERASTRPTLDVNGIWGGYTGEGAKTVIPSQAHAKISMRLVPNQDHEEISKLFKKHFESIAPKGVKVEVITQHGGKPALTPITSKAYEAASKAMEETYGKKPIPMRSGGSIPIISLFESELDVKTILLGFGLDSDAIHSPNEHFGLDNFYEGIHTISHFYKYFADENEDL